MKYHGDEHKDLIKIVRCFQPNGEQPLSAEPNALSFVETLVEYYQNQQGHKNQQGLVCPYQAEQHHHHHILYKELLDFYHQQFYLIEGPDKHQRHGLCVLNNPPFLY